jgi:hypothetical protein
MKKIVSISVLAMVVSMALSGCMDIKPEKVGIQVNPSPVKQENTVQTAQVDPLLAPPTGKDLYEDQSILKMSKGKATVKHADGKEEEVSAELAMVPGDTITIQSGGAGTLVWFDDSISRLKEGTTLTIDKADFDTNDVTKTDIDFHVVKGEIWNKVQGLVNPDSKFLSYAGSVVSGVRGSTYNLIVEGDSVKVESVAHAAFMAQVDPETMAFKNEKRLIRGQFASIAGDKAIQLAFIPQKRLSEQWFTDNGSQDKTASQQWVEKNKERLFHRVGILPGEPGYEEKSNQLQSELEAITDPIAHAEFAARLAQLKANESVALALKDPASLNAESTASRFDAVQSAIQASGLPTDVATRLKAEAQTQLRVLDRSVEDALPETDTAFKVKDALRNTEVKLAPDEKTQKVIKEKLLERTYFELNDAKSNPGFVMPKDLGAKFSEVQGQLQNLSDFWKNNQLFKQDYLNIIKNIQANPTDAAAIQKLQNYFQNPATQLKLQQAQKTIEQALPAIQEQLKKLPIEGSAINLMGVPAVEAPTATAPTTTDSTTDTTTPSTDTTSAVVPQAIAPIIKTLPTIDTSKLNLLKTTIR